MASSPPVPPRPRPGSTEKPAVPPKPLSPARKKPAIPPRPLSDAIEGPPIPTKPIVPQRPPSYTKTRSTLRFTNLETGEIVYTRLVIVEGTLGPGSPNGSLSVSSDARSGFKACTWEINQDYFKALVPLIPGNNDLMFSWCRSDSDERGAENVKVVYDRPTTAPHVHLAIVAASDSPVWRNDGRKSPSVPRKPTSQTASNHISKGDKTSRFLSKATDKLDLASVSHGEPLDESERAIVDAPQGHRREVLRAGGLAEVKRRVALQAYLWQAFHAEQMRRHGMDRRAFQLDDTYYDPSPGSSAQGEHALELLPRIHLLRSNRTLREFRDPDNAQQYPNARNGGAQHQFAVEALQDPSTPQELRWSPVAVLTLDTIYDPRMRLIRGHAAVGAGASGQLSHGVMGSHWLWAAPSSLDAVTAAFLDTERTDESCCVNNLRECETAWQTLNIGSGAFAHELGHALNNPHWESGLMARGYVEFNRAFMTREPGCRRNGVPSGRFFAPIHEGNDDKHNHLHRAQATRARWHLCFYIPTDPPLPYLTSNDQATWAQWNENEPSWTSTPDGALLKCDSGIGSLEIKFNDACKTHVEWLNLIPGDTDTQMPPRETLIDAAYLNQLVGFDVSHPSSPRVKLNAVACNMRQAELEDFRENGVARPVKINGFDSGKRQVFKTMHHGRMGDADQLWKLLFPHENDKYPEARLVAVKIYSGAYVDGLVFDYGPTGGQAQFGPCEGGECFRFELKPGEGIQRIKVRAGWWLDACEIVLTTGRSSGMRGNTTGGSLRVLEPPGQDGRIVGLYGTSGDWMNSIGAFVSS
ncbi:hypothetical protein NDA13_002799 [Ustilago tritici]|nr:hypothetical protein NDA13_002799 [Ustilago tritici]